jgi:SAM-dependent methyltransferase
MSDAAAQFIQAFESSLSEGSFVRLTLSKYRGREADLRNLYIRSVLIKNAPRLSFLYRHQTRDVTKNFEPSEGFDLVRALLGAEFLSAHLFTRDADLRLEYNRRREPRLTRHPPTLADAPAPEHDRRKQRLIETAGNVYLRELGVTDERGTPRPAMGDKFRQISKFVEVLSGLIASSPLDAEREFRVVDMGSGKGYLTFAVYDYLSNTLSASAQVTGVEARRELVELCNGVAARAGFAGLRFVQGLIDAYELPETDLLIALHACDTATDDALYKGIAAGASIIITAPCCHKEVRPQMRAPDALRGVLRHGILLEREAEAVTDSLRALLLEAAGYKVKVFEFVSTEHTRKNTMIAGVRRGAGADRAEALRQFRQLKEFYGIGQQRLETLLCEGRFI